MDFWAISKTSYSNVVYDINNFGRIQFTQIDGSSVFARYIKSVKKKDT